MVQEYEIELKIKAKRGYSKKYTFEIKSSFNELYMAEAIEKYLMDEYAEQLKKNKKE